LKVGARKVEPTGYTDVPDQPEIDTLLHSPPSLGIKHVDQFDPLEVRVHRGWVMHEPEIDVFQSEVFEGYFTCRQDVFKSMRGYNKLCQAGVELRNMREKWMYCSKALSSPIFQTWGCQTV